MSFELTKIEPLTEVQLKEIETRKVIPDGWLKSYLLGKPWMLVDKECKPSENPNFNFR